MNKHNHPYGSEVFMSKGILTKREKEVFSLLVENKTTHDIAEILGISEKFTICYFTKNTITHITSFFRLISFTFLL